MWQLWLLPLAGVALTTLGLIASALIARRIGFGAPIWMLPLGCLAAGVVLYNIGAQAIATFLVAPTAVFYPFFLAFAPWPRGATTRSAA